MSDIVIFNGGVIDAENVIVVPDGTWQIEVVREVGGSPRMKTETIKLSRHEDGIVMAYDSTFPNPNWTEKLYVWDSHRAFLGTGVMHDERLDGKLT